MRTEREIIDDVLAIATRDSGVRAVIQTDLLPVREYLHACNFIFIVQDIDRYDGDIFRDCLGERILLFRGDRNYPEMFPNAKAHLMVFRDGTTIVIHAMDRDAFLERYNGTHAQADVWIGETYRKLLDKDDGLPRIERLEERQTLSSEVPTQEAFLDACGEFWWVMKTLAEYTLREELPAAMYYLNVSVRGMLNKMLRWHIRLQVGMPMDMGILDSNLERLLEEDMFSLYKATYPDADYGHIWEAFDAVVKLWNKAGNLVAKRCGFEYPLAVENNILEFIRKLKEHKVV